MIGFVWLMAAILSAPVWAGCVRLVQLQPNSSSSSYTASSSANDEWDQQHLMDLCYSVSLILFGFVWPLAALCWLYLRMYEAALKNSARTRRQSLCSNPTPADTAVQQAVGGADNGPVGSCPSLADALTSAGAAATVAAQTQTSANLLVAAASAAAAAAASSSSSNNSNRTRRRDNRCVLLIIFTFQVIKKVKKKSPV